MDRSLRNPSPWSLKSPPSTHDLQLCCAQGKKCNMLCGAIHGVTRDPVDESRPSIRWQMDPADFTVSSPEGGSCYYCEATWRSKIAHRQEVRDKQKWIDATISKDNDQLQETLKLRDGVMEKQKAKHQKKGARREGGVKSVAVRQQTFDETKLIKPEDEFWPLDRYRAKFGDPSSQKNKKLGHVKTVVEGHAGVCVPTDDGTGPWRLQRAMGRRNELDREEDVGSDGGDESEAEGKYLDMRKKDTEQHRAIAQGALSSILKECVMTEEEMKKEEEKLKKAKAQKRRRAKQAKSAGKKKLARSFARMYDSDDDQDLSSDGGKPGPSRAPIKRPQKSTQGTSNATPPSSKKKEGSSQVDGDQGNQDGDEQGDQERGRGNPGKDYVELTEVLWDEFSKDDESGASFSAKNSVAHKRLVVRWKGVIQNKEAAEKDESKKFAKQRAVKKLQLVEMSMNIHSKQKARGSDELLALKTFENSFQSLLSFASADPAQEYQCRFICGLRLQLKAWSSLHSSRGLAISASITSCVY